jgi:hypothetical protein
MRLWTLSHVAVPRALKSALKSMPSDSRHQQQEGLARKPLHRAPSSHDTNRVSGSMGPGTLREISRFT